jgi:hypothetical protein
MKRELLRKVVDQAAVLNMHSAALQSAAAALAQLGDADGGLATLITNIFEQISTHTLVLIGETCSWRAPGDALQLACHTAQCHGLVDQ